MPQMYIRQPELVCSTCIHFTKAKERESNILTNNIESQLRYGFTKVPNSGTRKVFKRK